MKKTTTEAPPAPASPSEADPRAERYSKVFLAALQGFCANPVAGDPVERAAAVAAVTIEKNLDQHPEFRS